MLPAGGKVLTGFAGPCPERANLAAGAALEHGATRLGALVVGQIASRGRHNWETDVAMAEQITQRNGKQPHPRSVARVRRSLTGLGIIVAQRKYPGQRLPREARFPRSSHGCIVKRLNFGALGVRDPLGRHRRPTAVEIVQQPAADTDAGGTLGARRSVSPAEVRSHKVSVPIDPELARMAAEGAAVLERREQAQEAREDAAMLATLPRARSKPP